MRWSWFEAVRAAGVPVGLASNSSREFVERVLSVAGMLDGHFDVIVTADDVEHPKPAPDLYLAACEASRPRRRGPRRSRTRPRAWLRRWPRACS